MRTRIQRAKLAAALATKDLTVTELARMTGISRTTISAIKSGKSCSTAVAQKLAAVLGDEILIKESEVPKNNA